MKGLRDLPADDSLDDDAVIAEIEALCAPKTPTALPTSCAALAEPKATSRDKVVALEALLGTGSQVEISVAESAEAAESLAQSPESIGVLAFVCVGAEDPAIGRDFNNHPTTVTPEAVLGAMDAPLTLKAPPMRRHFPRQPTGHTGDPRILNASPALPPPPLQHAWRPRRALPLRLSGLLCW